MPTSISDFASFSSLLSPLISELGRRDWAYIDEALKPAEVTKLKAWAQTQKASGQFLPAQMGRGNERHLQSDSRGDSILWLNAELQPEIFIHLEALRTELNRSLYLGLQTFECHLACYPPGGRYLPHIDQSPNHQPLLGERVISFVLYLNESWQTDDGGELVICKSQERISPIGGRLVIFQSQTVEHEVLTSQKDRWSLTGWFRRSRL